MDSESDVIQSDVNQSVERPVIVERPAAHSALRLDEADRLSLELSKARRQVALADAKASLAVNEKEEIQYKYVVLQIYMKYGLTANDAIKENGEIIIGGAPKVNQPG